MNPAYRFGAQQSDKLTAVGDLRRSSTNGAAVARAPVNLPSRDRIVLTCDLCSFRRGGRPLATATAGRADAYKQLPLLGAGGLAAAATLQDPVDKLTYGIISRTQPFGSAGAIPSTTAYYA